MTTEHAQSDFAAIRARIRAEVGTEPLVSAAQLPVHAAIGGLAWQRVPWDFDGVVAGGTIVALHREDDEQGVICFDVRGRNHALEAKVSSLLLSDCASVEPFSAWRSYKVIRQLAALMGQRTAANGPPFEDHELRWLQWQDNLRAAVGMGPMHPDREAA